MSIISVQSAGNSDAKDDASKKEAKKEVTKEDSEHVSVSVEEVIEFFKLMGLEEYEWDWDALRKYMHENHPGAVYMINPMPYYYITEEEALNRVLDLISEGDYKEAANHLRNWRAFHVDKKELEEMLERKKLIFDSIEMFIDFFECGGFEKYEWDWDAYEKYMAENRTDSADYMIDPTPYYDMTELEALKIVSNYVSEGEYRKAAHELRAWRKFHRVSKPSELS